MQIGGEENCVTRDLYQQSPQALANDVQLSIALLRDLHAALGTPIDPATQQRIEQLEADSR